MPGLTKKMPGMKEQGFEENLMFYYVYIKFITGGDKIPLYTQNTPY